MKNRLPTRLEAKAQARRLRAGLGERGIRIGHAQALERVAHDHGFRDWNALHAAIDDRPPANWTRGGRVSGTYLLQSFTARVVDAEPLRSGWVRMVLDLDDPVDVVSFDGFSNLRRRIRGLVGPRGHSRERTSTGNAHLRIEIGAPE
ncbi:glyoxalase superfamily protein [Stappia sp. ES.058]|uniref:glyoxalase superfamily protein n=1 Tax=Stappia sp. ES.058 TaxID=1881061 RepID=UPI00087B196C|nr:glyoxalase superfamily protein [Stappia sp. ES.058]SDU28450.1 hypothetical protein SAMN05428979_2738 [Stappia sp. ES.058]